MIRLNQIYVTISTIILISFLTGCSTLPVTPGKTLIAGDFELIGIKGGTFLMGSAYGQSDEKPVHSVTVRDFYISKYEVTQELYRKVMNENPSRYKGDNLPVDNVSWVKAVEFCKKFGKKYGISVRLPTEAEWEYACRAGSRTTFYWGNKMNGAYAWYKKNSDGKPHPVGTKKPNRWGLYDMLGNVWEWCRDWYKEDYYNNSPPLNPGGPDSVLQTRRCVRGGAFKFGPEYLRSSNRYFSEPSYRIMGHGFRIVSAD